MQTHDAKIIYLFFFFFIAEAIFGQENLPTIKAISDKVDIAVGDDFYLKGGWILEPHKKPDTFSIGSKWLYDTKKVAFRTDIDSIVFNVKPGNRYDFIVLNGDSCHIRIVTLPNPVFLNYNILIFIAAGFIIILLLVQTGKNRISIILLLSFGYVSVLLFWLTTFISGYIQGNYNHLKDVISKLGALGTKPEIITSASLLLISLLYILFSVGFYKSSKIFKISRIPAILSFSMPASLFWAAVFPLGNEFHNLTGPLPLLVIAASLCAFMLWKNDKDFAALRYLSILSFFTMMLILLRFIQPFGLENAGLIQRFYYLGWSIWTIALSYYFIKRYRNIERKFNRVI